MVSIVLAKRQDVTTLVNSEILTTLTDKVRKYALIIGVTGYSRFPDDRRLEFADNDAELFSAFIQSPNGGLFPKDNVRLLLNKEATRERIYEEIEWLGNKVTGNDLVYIFFSGHGWLDNNDLAYLMPSESTPYNARGTGIRADRFFEDLNITINPRYMIFFIDACHASAALNPMGQAKDGSSNKTPDFREIWERAFVKQEGIRMGFFSASSTQRSWENKELQQGLFTYYMIAGMKGAADFNKDGKVVADELYSYIYQQVREHSKKYQSIQTPTMSPKFDPSFPLAVITLEDK